MATAPQVSSKIVVHPRTAGPGSLRVWVGIFDRSGIPPQLTWLIDGQAVGPTDVLRELAPGWPRAGEQGRLPAVTGVYEFGNVLPGSSHSIQAIVETDGQSEASKLLWTRSLPIAVPGGTDGSFNVLLVSCFCQLTDPAGVVGQIVKTLPTHQRPHLTLLMGDQVYLDNPIGERSLDQAVLAERFEKQYRGNWTVPDGKGNSYADLLDAAPSAAIPDDHEFWNNHPHRFAAAPTTWSAEGRESWYVVARAMYRAFQQDDPTTYNRIIEVHPLSFYLMDNRTFRQADFETTTMSPDGQLEFNAWVDGVIAARGIPVLVTGPSLFQDPKGRVKKRLMDSNLSNYPDFDFIMAGLGRLAEAGRPVLCLTGDVHYGRVVKGSYGLAANTSVHEVISSPSSLVPTPGKDSVSNVKARFRDIFGRRDVAPRWPTAKFPPEKFHVPKVHTPTNLHLVYPDRDDLAAAKGDHVVLLSFRATQFGVDMTPTYVMLPKADSSSVRGSRILKTIHI